MIDNPSPPSRAGGEARGRGGAGGAKRGSGAGVGRRGVGARRRGNKIKGVDVCLPRVGGLNV